MRTSIKIIILVFGVIIAAAAVLLFIKTQVAPPGQVVMKDPYSSSLNADVSKVGEQPFPSCKDNFFKAYHKVNFMKSEELLNNEQADEMIVKIDTAYGNKVVDYAFRIFNSSSWPENDLNQVTSTMASLRADKLSTGQRSITPELESSFSEIDGVLKNYRAAWTFAKNTGFRSVEDARSRINSIDTHKQKAYLNNNTALMAALNALPGAIANSHYNHVAAQVNRLGGYRSMSINQFDDLATHVESVMREYSNVNFYGSNKKSVASLRDKAERLSETAYEYYSDY